MNDEAVNRTSLHTFSGNEEGRDWVVGDLHGCLDIFLEALRHLGFDEKTDRIFCVGDLIDRGPQSLKTLRLLREPWFHSVLGNHEEVALAWFDHGMQVKGEWIQQDGKWLLERTMDELHEIRALLQSIPLVIRVEPTENAHSFLIVHADLPRDGKNPLTLSSFERMIETGMQPDERGRMLWGRDMVRSTIKSFHARVARDIPRIYSGHTIIARPMRVGGQCFMDTGAYHDGGALTLALAGRGEWFQFTEKGQHAKGRF